MRPPRPGTQAEDRSSRQGSRSRDDRNAQEYDEDLRSHSNKEAHARPARSARRAGRISGYGPGLLGESIAESLSSNPENHTSHSGSTRGKSQQRSAGSVGTSNVEWGRNADRHIQRLREYLLFILVGATLFMSLTIYYTVFFEQVHSFQEQFEAIAVQYLYQVESQFQNTLTVLHGTSRTPTVAPSTDRAGSADAAATNNGSNLSSRRLQPQQQQQQYSAAQWPFRTVPSQDWPSIAASTLSLGKFEWIAVAPFLDDNEQLRADYEAYVARVAPEWIHYAATYREDNRQQHVTDSSPSVTAHSDNDDYSNILFNATHLLQQRSAQDTLVEAIFESDPNTDLFFRIQPPRTGPYCPVHQHYPVATTTVNYNLLSHRIYGEELRVALSLFRQRSSSDLRNAMYVGTLVDSLVEYADDVDLEGVTKKSFRYDGLRLRQPTAMVYVPIENTEPAASASANSENDNPRAFWIGKFRWIDMLQASDLNEKTRGMQIVLDHRCRKPAIDDSDNDVVLVISTTTFQVDDNLQTQWLGYGDLHKSTLGYLEESSVLEEPALQRDSNAFANLKTAMNTDGDGDGDDGLPCMQFEYELRIYPSQQMKDRFFDLSPIFYTAVVLVVFAIASAVFVGYDYYVNRRNEVVVQSAIRHHAMVSSLFPKTIRERLFKAADVEVAPDRRSKNKRRHPTEVVDNSIHGRMMTQRARLKNILTSASGSASVAASDDGDSKRSGKQSVGKYGGNSSAYEPSSAAGDEDDDDDDVRTASSNRTGVKSSNSKPARGLIRKFLGATAGSNNNMWLRTASNNQIPNSRNSGMSGQSMHSKHSNHTIVKKAAPIADFFTKTTVLFADIAGFTAWSSTREPTQVFTLLETLYGSFDELADKHKVFKVETIGDSYVAVTGLPDPQPTHAVIMSRFAYEMQVQMTMLTRQLVVELGPDTAELSLRIGLHSGPVTAGVLRGQKSRFQLFGDTVNTAARMESTGKSHHIQCSKATAEALEGAGKSLWLIPREDVIFAKGKGSLQTFWIDPRGHRRRKRRADGLKNSMHSKQDSQGRIRVDDDKSYAASDTSDSISAKEEGTSSQPFADASSLHSQRSSSVEASVEDDRFMQDSASSGSANDNNPNGSSHHKKGRKLRSARSADFERHLDWNVDLLSRLLKYIIARQLTKQDVERHQQQEQSPEPGLSLAVNSHITETRALEDELEDYGLKLPREEYAECIHLPQYRPSKGTEGRRIPEKHPEDIVLDDIVQEELRDYVTKIACSYHDNPFHNYDHATHVTMSANKILNRVVAAEDIELRGTKQPKRRSLDAVRHAYTYGITSDPLTHFACVFSAMIHDVDHPGVSNAQLIKEKDEMAELYGRKSVAEQNSVDLAWGLLMDPAYQNLRGVLFASDEEKRRFRQLLVNSVMATDIFDQELVATRNRRWAKAFEKIPILESASADDHKAKADLRATIVIEHIIQAADVNHTMQHWHIYQKWNRRLFNEMYRAYKSGRLDKDPSEGWYKGELWFYDNYIIPLAKKLKDCGVFGVSSDEFLNYAMMNRSEWEMKGEQIVADLVSSYNEAGVLSRTSSARSFE